MTVKSCPEFKTLKLLLTGAILGANAESLEQHLLNCDQCLLAARNIPANDELVAAIRARREFAEETGLLAQAIERAKQFRAESETVESVDTLTIGQGVEVSGKTPSLSKHTNLDADIDFLAPPQQADEIGRIGDYRVLEVLGAGGMGIVFRAEDTKLRRQVALKTMKPAAATSRSAKDRFVREAQATAAIDHDNIVHIYQVGEDRNVPFIAMQFLRGESLQKRLQRDGRLDQREVVRIGREIAAGLAVAHQRGLIHRDIKPDNIWLDAAAHRAKILDFGLVRMSSDDDGLTQSGMVLGTPKYMAPEQAKGETVDNRCDLFSLGSVLYHLASGQPPFEGGSLTATLIAVTQADCRPLADVCPELHPELAGLITRLMSKDRNTRFQTAAEVADNLARIEKQLDEMPPNYTDKTNQRQLTETVGLNRSPVTEPVLAGNSSTRQRSLRSGPILIGGTVTGIVLVVLAWLYFAGIINIETKDGALAIKVTGDNIGTSVEGQKVTIKNRETNETYTIVLGSGEKNTSLKPGSYFILETDSGLKMPTDHFTIRSGKTQVVEVTWVPKTAKGPEGVISPDPDPERRAAEWVLSIGGKLRVSGADQEIRSMIALPKKRFIIEMVWLRDNQLATDAGLAVFADCKYLSELTHLDLRSTPVTDAGLVHFKNCRKLSILDIPYTQIGDEGLANFKACKLLTSLWLHRTLVTDAGLANFNGCRNLAQLSLLDTEITNDGLANFSESRNLIQMYLGGTRIDDVGLAHFKGCTSFRKIDLNGTQVSDTGIAMLQNCKYLDTLKVNQTNVTAGGVDKFRKALPNCKVEWQRPDAKLGSAPGLERLQAHPKWEIPVRSAPSSASPLHPAH